MELGGFDAEQEAVRTSRDPIPNGDYQVAIIEGEQKSTRSGEGEYLKLVFEVLEGEHQGRKLFVNLNLHNKNDTAVKIAREELAEICRALRITKPNDSDELLNIPLLARVKCVKNRETQDMENKITNYADPAVGFKTKAVGTAPAARRSATAYTPPAAPQRAAAPATPTAAPWAKK